jgi:hypothetical protein
MANNHGALMQNRRKIRLIALARAPEECHMRNIQPSHWPDLLSQGVGQLAP